MCCTEQATQSCRFNSSNFSVHLNSICINLFEYASSITATLALLPEHELQKDIVTVTFSQWACMHNHNACAQSAFLPLILWLGRNSQREKVSSSTSGCSQVLVMSLITLTYCMSKFPVNSTPFKHEHSLSQPKAGHSDSPGIQMCSISLTWWSII